MLVCLAALSGLAAASQPAANAADAPGAESGGSATGASSAGRMTPASFVCADGKKIRAVFITGAHPSVMLELSDGRHLQLLQAAAASGARYANADESVVFWNKGRTAFIEEHGQRSYSGCVQRP